MTQVKNSPETAAPPIWLALYQPDIPQNTGAIVRMAACLGVPVSIIEPAGFPVSDRAFRRAGMDYVEHAVIDRHVSWSAFLDWRANRRLILATTRGETAHIDAVFRAGDILLFGRETSGVPEDVSALADLRLRIPMRPGVRSLNLAVSAAILAGEALRQLQAYPMDRR